MSNRSARIAEEISREMGLTVAIEIMRNKQDKAYGFRFHYEGEMFKASEIWREFGYRSLFNQFGLSDLKPQTGQTVVPIYEPVQEQEQGLDLDLSVADTAINIVGELSSAVGSVFTVHGEDYKETAFQHKNEGADEEKEGEEDLKILSKYSSTFQR